MKTKRIIFTLLVSVLLVVPVSVSAFSYVDVLNFGKKILKRQEAAPKVELKTQEAIPLNPIQKELADEKYRNWESAWNEKDITNVFRQKYNFYFSQGELNYIIGQRLKEIKSPPAEEVTINLMEDGTVKLSGRSLIKFMKGDFYVELKFLQGRGSQVYPKVTKARLHGLYMPPIIVSNLIQREINDTIKFFYGNAEHQDMNIEVGDGYLRLNYPGYNQ